MHQGSRIGEILSRTVPLSRHDVEEILHEQAGSRRRFGHIALTWGLCRPEHVWNAWCSQLREGPQRVDLDDVGIDGQSIAHLSHELAIEYGVVPIRNLGDQLIVAVDERGYDRASVELSQQTSKILRFVLADESQVRRAIEENYRSVTV